MAESCKKCDSDIVQVKEAFKCADCGGLHHPACVKVPGDKKSASRRGWKCEVCVGETSSTGSRASETQQAASVLEALASLRKELNDKLDQSFDRLGKVQDDIAAVKADLSGLTVKYGELQAVTRKTAEDVGELQAENGRLSKEVLTLTAEVEDLQQHTRKNNLIVSGVPITPRENVFLVLESLARAMDVDYRRYDISAAHRLPAMANDNRPPSIVVCFVSRLVKEEWMRARRNRRRLSARDLHDSFPDQPVYINEHLTRLTRQIFNAARALAKTQKLAMVWTSDCRVLAKKSPSSNPFRIRSLRHVSDLAGLPSARGENATTE